MNLKERGITVGDFLILFIIIITITTIFKTFKKDKKTTINQINQENISHKKILLSRNYWNDFNLK